MALPDKVSDDLNLYIGGLFTLRRKEALQNARVTHVLSVLRQPLDQKLFQGFTHKVVELDDIDDENFLEHFPACVRFIQDGLDSGGGVLVHCAMGKSRSATAVCAYLICHLNLDPTTALAHLRLARSICEPNEGFMEQLELWHRMGSPVDQLNLDDNPSYQRWLYRREIALSRACGQAPEPDKIRFEDEHQSHSSPSSSSPFTLTCRKCRRPLATSLYLSSPVHTPPQHQSADMVCAHYFLDPLSWMRPALEQGRLEGRLECPKCAANVGKYAWQGMQCSCGEWIVPGISLAKGRVDRVEGRTGSGSGGGTGIRVGPGVAVGAAGTTGVPEGGGRGGGGGIGRKGGQENL